MVSLELNSIKKVLITGSSGAIGSVLCPFLMEQGYFIRGLDKVKKKTTSEFFQGNILDRDSVISSLTEMEAVIHLAACSDESDFETDLIPNNIIGLNILLQEAYRQKTKRIILASSIHTVNFLNAEERFSTKDRSPFTFYGMTKLWGEDLAEKYAREYELSIITARLGWFIRNNKEFKEAKKNPNAGDYYLSPNDMCQFFIKCLKAQNITFEKLYATSIPIKHKTFDLETSQEKINYIPIDSFANCLSSEAMKAKVYG